MNKLPDKISNTVSKVSDMFKNYPTKQERMEDGLDECAEPKDKNGRQTGGYGVIKYDSGDTEIHYDEFENDKPSTGHGVIISQDGIITYYEVSYEYDINGKQISHYKIQDFSSDGTKLKEYTKTEYDNAK